MNPKKANILKKTIKIASFTCVALGGAALVASGAALKALTEGAKYLKNTVEKIVTESDPEEVVIDTVAAEEFEEEPAAAENCEPEDIIS